MAQPLQSYFPPLWSLQVIALFCCEAHGLCRLARGGQGAEESDITGLLLVIFRG